jgi:hypothetical protein
MPDFSTLKLDGTRLVPINRFNLEASRPSVSFVEKPKVEPAFTVIEHPFIHSVSLIEAILMKEYFPLIEKDQAIEKTTIFKDYTDNKISLCFPELELLPNNNQIFYYENLLDDKGQNKGLIGKVTLKYNIKNKPTNATLQNINLSLKEVILNLKVINNDVIKINGVIDDTKKEIVFNITDEAVKIAFSNLTSEFDNAKCSLDLFFSFKGYSKFQKRFLFARDFATINNSKLSRIDMKNAIPAEKLFIGKPLFVNDNQPKAVAVKDQVRDLQVLHGFNTNIQEEYVKSTFLLKINQVINYPLSKEASTSLYKTVGGGFINNPFNLNEDYSQYKQIYVPGVNFDKLSIYKSTMSLNEFLIISKRYCITRSTDSKLPCIKTIFHAKEEGTALVDDISKINFQFALGPDLSDYDLAKLKIDLFNNKFLDGDTTNYIDTVRFLYPNEIESEYEISGNHFLQGADITSDGKHFLVSITTENLNQASILTNAINNSISQYANINFKHKEIKDTSIIDINIQKTIGEILGIAKDSTTKKISIENLSLSKCKINSVLTIDEQNNNFFNSSSFSSTSLLDNGQKIEFLETSLNASLLGKTLKNVFFDFESIEDLSKEFDQIRSTSSTYNKYVQIQIQSQKSKVTRMQIELKVNQTEGMFNFEKLKADFKNPILFNFMTFNSVTNLTTIAYKVNCFDKDNNILTTNDYVFDYTNSSVIIIPKI